MPFYYLTSTQGLNTPLLCSFSPLLPQGVAEDVVTDKSVIFPMNYRSTWNWALGVEYQYSDQWGIRGGIEERPSAMPENATNVLAPFGEAWLFGLGVAYNPYAGYDLESRIDVLLLEFSYQTIF